MICVQRWYGLAARSDRGCVGVAPQRVSREVESPQQCHWTRPGFRPNVVLVMMDDLGYGDVGSYGARDVQTPNIDRLAREGVRLTDFYANAPTCTPTRAALISGRYQQRVGLEAPLGYGKRARKRGLRPSPHSLPALLKTRGAMRRASSGSGISASVRRWNPTSTGSINSWGFLSGGSTSTVTVGGTGRPISTITGSPFGTMATSPTS